MTNVKRPVTALLAALGAAVAVAPAAVAQPSPALEALTEVLDLARTARGWVVRHREGILVLRGEDDRIYEINTAGLDTSALAHLREGRFVTVALKRSVTAGAMPIAAPVEAIEPAAAPRLPGAPRDR
jgi:hypothetical protein